MNLADGQRTALAVEVAAVLITVVEVLDEGIFAGIGFGFRPVPMVFAQQVAQVVVDDDGLLASRGMAIGFW